MRDKRDAEKAILMISFARIDILALAIAVSVIFSLLFFVATGVLLIKGAPSGIPVGPTLSKLSMFLPGYSVSWGGSIIGVLYAGVIGFVSGATLAILWNLTHFIYITLAVIRAHWWRMMID